MTDDDYNFHLDRGTVDVDGKEIPISDLSLHVENNIEESGFEKRLTRPSEFEGSITITLNPGDKAPCPCPECDHVPIEVGETIDELAALECPKCDWFDVLDEPLDEIYGDES